MIDGTKIVAARVELRWTRQQFLEYANDVADREGLPSLTYSKLTQIENGKRDPRQEEESLIRRVFAEVLDRVITEEVPIVLAPEDRPQVPTKLTEWNGFKEGDRCRVAGERKPYRFLFYYVDSNQEYVEVSGPLMSFRGKTVGVRRRSLHPEKILRFRA